MKDLINTVESFFPLIGRVLLVLLFLVTGVNMAQEFTGASGFIGSIIGTTLAAPALILLILVKIVGSAMIVVGYRVKWGAYPLALFCIFTAFMFHFQFPEQTAIFFKNLAIAGGFLLLIAYGPGKWSLDEKNKRLTGAMM